MLFANPLFSQTVQITTATYPGAAATSCTNTFIDVGVMVLCINASYNGATFNVSGNVIDINLDHSLGPICLGAISNSIKNINLGMLPANNYTVNINGVLNNTNVSTLVSSLNVVSCCSASPAFSLSNSDTICEGDSIAFTSLGTSLTSTTWYENNTLASSNPSFGKRFNTPGVYQIKLVASDATCSDSLTKTVLVNAIPQISLGNDTALCSNATLSLWAGSNLDSVVWSDGSTSDSLLVDTSGTFSATIYKGGCSSMDVINVSLIQPPMVDIGGDTTLCMGDSLVLDATVTGATYVWQDNSTSSSLIARDSGVYWVQVMAANGCVSSRSLTLLIDTTCTVSLNEKQIATHISLYPNPAKDKLFLSIDAKENQKLSLQIIDSKGQLVLSQQNLSLSTVKNGIDLSSFPKGLYILNLRIDDLEMSQAFSKIN